jgi:isopenicillin N synthase-like dioxygenase
MLISPLHGPMLIQLQACRTAGFFYVTNHGVDRDLEQALEQTTEWFFNLPPDLKREFRMERGGKAWRGYDTN